jgi:sec-independent protein translocase protein TatA
MELGIGEIVVILVVVLVFFGPTKLPQLGEALGRGIRNLKKAASEPEARAATNVSSAPHTLPAAPVTVPAPRDPGSAQRNHEPVPNHGVSA